MQYGTFLGRHPDNPVSLLLNLSFFQYFYYNIDARASATTRTRRYCGNGNDVSYFFIINLIYVSQFPFPFACLN